MNRFWNSSCTRCGAPAYLGFRELECSKRCAPETSPRDEEKTDPGLFDRLGLPVVART